MKLNDLFRWNFQHRSKDVSTRLLQNVFAETTNSMGKSDIIYVGTPGQRITVDKSADPLYKNLATRGMHYTSTGRLFVMWGGKLVEVLENGMVVDRYAMTDYPTQVSFADDGVTMVFVDGYILHIYNLDTNVVSVPPANDVDFKNPTKVVYSNGRAVVVNNDNTVDVGQNQVTRRSNRFYWSELRDLSSWNPLNFATAEQSAD